MEFSLRHFSLKTEVEEVVESPIDECEDIKSQCLQDALDSSNDFAILDREHLDLATYYGIREFLVLIPTKQVAISDETRIKILLSSITIAANNSNWSVTVAKTLKYFFV